MSRAVLSLKSVKSVLVLGLGLLLAAPLGAVETPESSPLTRLQFKAPELSISELSVPAVAVDDAEQRSRVQQLVSDANLAHFDLRTGRFTTLMPAVPLVAGSGVGNRITSTTAARSKTEIGSEAWNALRSWLVANQAALRLDLNEMAEVPRITVINPDFIQIYSPRRVAGLPVRDSFFTATIKYGNLILLGTMNWGDVAGSPIASVSEQDARAAMARYTAPLDPGQSWKSSELVWLPISKAESLSVAALGQGLDHRLVWVVRGKFGEVDGRYEALVDAENGDLLAFEDTRHYAATSRTVEGGVYPVSNDGMAPDGVEQADWPLPFSNVVTPSGTVATDIGGNLPACVDGSISSTLSGPFLVMNDNCGAASLSSTGDLDFGTSGGTDCTTPGIGGTGNTHASRSGFFELNMIKAMARGQLPNNTWLTEPLTANMNISATCNAGWNGAQVSFFRSGGGCNNTGELAGVFDHEWGHGMDDNDGVPTVSSPGEGIADLYASLRLDDSCIGRNFRATNCGGYGNPCTMCSGVRDIDWAKHTANTPFTMANADACGPGNSNGPCGGSVHCEGQVYSQAVWDLWNRDLVGVPFNLSLDVAREVATQLTYRGASGVATWFACSPGTGGCNNAAGCGCGATSGYQQYLAADDDNGNLADGTPHMQALFNAFSRHGIACTTPTVTTAGCTGTPTSVPVVTATPVDRGVTLSWTSSAGASGYRVYRTDGVFACSFGKQLLATVAGTSYQDDGLKNGRAYSYQVVPMGAADECFSVASSCTTATPVAGANFSAVPSQATLTLLSGDSDPFLDNCESAQVTVPISNIGAGSVSNLRIVAASSPSHPATTILTTFPATVTASLASCAEVSASFDFSAADLDPGETLILEFELTSDELSPLTRLVEVSFSAIEGDLQNFASKTFTFESDTEGWTTEAGTFQRDSAGGGANSTAFYMESSSFLDDQCDVVRSPVLRLNAGSTMTLFNNFNIEAFDGQWWDRANIGIRPVGSSIRTVVEPSSGRPYNAESIGGTCGTDGQDGWAGASPSWDDSVWTSTALQTGTFAGQLIQLEVRFGTDASVNNFGFRFDELTLTDVDLFTADTQSNFCASNLLFSDGFETGNTNNWSLVFP